MKKQKTAELEREHALLVRCKAQTEAEKPLREMELTPEERSWCAGLCSSRRSRSCMSSISPRARRWARTWRRRWRSIVWRRRPRGRTPGRRDLRQGGGRAGRDRGRRGGGVSGGLRPDRERAGAADPQELQLLGLVSFFTIGEPETRALAVQPTAAHQAPGAIHSDLEKYFIRAETIHWDTLLAAAPRRRRGRKEAPAGGQGLSRKGWRCANIRHSGYAMNITTMPATRFWLGLGLGCSRGWRTTWAGFCWCGGRLRRGRCGTLWRWARGSCWRRRCWRCCRRP